MTHNLDAVYFLDQQTGVFARSQKEPFSYSDGDEVEQRIARVIREADDLSIFSRELEAHCTDWPSRYHLSGTRSNLLRPYKNLLRGDILEIGAGCGAITRYLGESGAQVTALEGSYRRAAIAASRNRDAANVKVICDNFLLFEDERKFDVVTLIGVLEYAQMFDPEPGAVDRLLGRAKTFLKPSGVLLLAIENKLGLKYFAGMAADHVNHGMYGVESLYRSRDPITFGREELDRLLSASGFAKTTFAFPFPDYKLPLSVVMPAGMNESPTVFNASSFASESAHLDPQICLPSLISLELGWQSLGSNGLLGELANSFLIVASPSSQAEFGDDNVLAWHYGSRRRESYTKETAFRRVGAEIRVEKRLHQQATSTNNGERDEFHSPRDELYLSGVPYRVEFARILARPSWSMQEVASYFRRFIDFLAAGYSDGTLGSSPRSSSMLRPEAVDILPHNIIVAGSRLVAIDIEWNPREPVELGFVLFRSLIYLINPLTRCGYPDDFGMADRNEFVMRVYQELFAEVPRRDFERWWAQEKQFQQDVTGNIEERSFDDWCRASFPILDPSTRSIAGILLEVNGLRFANANFERGLINLSERVRESWDFIKAGALQAEPPQEKNANFGGPLYLLESDVERLDARSRELFEDLLSAKSSEASLQSVVTETALRLEAERVEAEALRTENVRLSADLQSQREATFVSLKDNKILSGELLRMQASLSWRLTKPLRAMKAALKR